MRPPVRTVSVDIFINFICSQSLSIILHSLQSLIVGSNVSSHSWIAATINDLSVLFPNYFSFIQEP